MITTYDFLMRLNNMPLLRHKEYSINPYDTIVFCFPEDIEFAINHYESKYKICPEIVILGNKGYNNYPPAQDYIYIFKKKLLFIPQNKNIYHFNNAVRYLNKIGIYSFDYDYNVSCDKISTLEFEDIAKDIPILVELYNSLEDNESKDIFLGALKSRLTKGLAGYYHISSYPCYFHPKIDINENEIVIDAGIGMCSEPTFSFSKKVGSNGKVYAFECDKHCIEFAKNRFKDYNNIEIVELGLWDKDDELYFKHLDKDSSHITINSLNYTSDSKIKVTKLDTWVEHNNISPSFIKMDIEGAELQALQGSIKTLTNFRPKLSICTYHQPFNSIYTIFHYLKNTLTNYKFYFGHHTAFHLDSILYAIPNELSKEAANINPSHYSNVTESLVPEDLIRKSSLRKARIVEKNKKIVEDNKTLLKKLNEELSGKSIYIWGNGAAYEYYSPFCTKLSPECFIVNNGYFSVKNSFTVRTPEELIDNNSPALPCIMFVRENFIQWADIVNTKYSKLISGELYLIVLPSPLE